MERSELQAGKTFVIDAESDTRKLAEALAPLLHPGDILALEGQMGSGKTFFTRQLCRALNCRDVTTSPTFTLMNEYRGDIGVLHLDLYRLKSQAEFIDLGVFDFVDDNLTVIEWPELVNDLLPATTLRIRFTLENGHRTATVSTSDPGR